jgi:MYXO-CTERM domain-containing protein
MPDAGMPDSGTPDAGTPDAGRPDSGAPDSGTPPSDGGTTDSGTPLPDSGTPLPDAGGTFGEPCTTSCGGGLACYLPESRDQGICVPRCTGADDPTCPFRYDCSARLGICVPSVPEDTGGDDSNDTSSDSGGCGCRTAMRPDGSGALVLAFLMLAGGFRRRRRA